jgi:cytochrome c-type biogenesis protein CcmH
VATVAASTLNAEPGAAPAGVAQGAAISGTVTLAAALASQTLPTDTVFIFSRASQGPPMPLAILRKLVKDLPLDFRLDDSLAMSPASRLSSAAQVVVGARVSRSGDAMTQPGDLVAETVPAKLGSTGIRLDISRALPAK